MSLTNPHLSQPRHQKYKIRSKPKANNLQGSTYNLLNKFKEMPLL